MKPIKLPKSVKATVSITLLAGLFYLLDWQRLASLDAYALLYIAIGTTGTLGLNLFMATRWRLLIGQKNPRNLSFAKAYQGYLFGAFFNIFMPGAIGGDLMRINYAMSHTGINLKTSGLIIFMERLFGVGALLSLFLIGLLLGGANLPHIDFGQYQIHLLIAAVVLLSLIIIFASRRFRLPLHTAITAFLLSLLAQGSDALLSWLILSYVFPETPLFWLLIAMPVAIIATLLPISLGGLGVREGTLVGVLALFGVDPSSAILFSFMVYLSKVLVGLIGGIMLNLSRSSEQLQSR
ncbi:MAG: flippase-like domain-containing protein [gamma proteobacterium endosymbiont of Lamellibrachia anaximandri]|nr:flippase-like domain-containing protein [gamma proteobacterium endosymbiont of Lamellibrachia anaximandri]MBL3532321.1 flippase-like domain-containing protein [gamma proteobacterium endosymbiont of Lamellibrachia anaximandri]